MAMSISQQGSGFPFFSLTIYKYLSNTDISTYEVIIEDVPDPEIRAFLKRVSS